MRSILALIAGGPLRVSTSAGAIVLIGFVLAGHGWDLARSVWIALIAGWAFAMLFMVLAMVGAATGVSDDTAPTAKEPNRG